MRLIITGALAALCVALTANAQDSTEVEPNRTARQATAFDPERVMRGQIESQDTDFFRFEVDDGHVRDIGFELESEVKVDLCLYNDTGERLKCSRSTSTGFKELRLNGEYYLSLSPVAKMAAPVPYELRASAPRAATPGREVEPNDRWKDAFAVDVNDKINGTLSATDKDSFAFRLSGQRELFAIVVTGDAAASLELRSAGGIKLHDSSNENGEVRMDNLQLPQGNYAVRITGANKSTRPEYTLQFTSFGAPGSVDLTRLAPHPDASRPRGTIEAEPNDSGGQADRLGFDTHHVGTLTASDTDMYRFFLPGHGRVRIEAQPATGGKISVSLNGSSSFRSAAAGESAVYEGEILPGDHYLRVRSRPSGTGLYRLTMTQLDPLRATGKTLDSIVVTLPENLPELAAYVPVGQRLTIGMNIENTSEAAESLNVITSSSANSWRLRPAETELTLAPGQAKKIDVTLDVLSDARSDQPVLVSLGARNAAGELSTSSLALKAQCDGSPVNPVQLWPLPGAFLGRTNAASTGLGAEVVDHRRRDADAFDGIVSRSGGAWGRNDDTVTVDLAGDAALTVLGVILNPVGSGQRGLQLREFEILTSLDGTVFTSAFEGALTADAAEQSFVFDTPVKTKIVKIRLINSQSSDTGKIGFGELKVMVTEPAHVVTGHPVDVAANALGGYDVYSIPFAGTSSRHDPFSTRVADGQYRKLSNQFEWVMAFRDNRAARITRLHWIEDANRHHKQRDITNVDVQISLSSPLGPWQHVTNWELRRSEAGVDPLVLPAPVWARYVRFVAPPPANKKPPELPRHIQIIEQAAGDDYRSVTGEWGYTSRAAIFEYLYPPQLDSAVDHADAADQRQQASRLEEGSVASGDVLVGEDVDWYFVEVPSGSNQLRLEMSGTPGVEYAFEVQDEAGTVVATADTSSAGGALAIDVSPGRYYVKLFEPPRSIIFAWDTSGSVGPYYDVIDQTMKAFASGVSTGREEVNLQPFNDPHPRFLLEEWSGDTGVVSHAIVNSDRNFSSSNVESSLLFSSKELRKRQGTRAVLLITDAETDGYLLTDALWASLQKSRPRVFSFEISSGGSLTAQDLMQSYAEVNQGFYDQALSAGDLQVGFDRAICMLRRPKQYHVATHFDTVPEKPDGQLLVALDTSASLSADAVEVILDASGSMYQKLEGRFRYSIAKDVLEDLVLNTLPENIGFALRVFGNREASSCRTDLEIDLAPLDRSKAVEVIKTIEPQQFAYTPIAASLAKVSSDLRSVTGRRTVVLITDGEESCDGDVEAAITLLKESGIDVQLNVIGFDFDASDKAALRDVFRDWADLGGGEYYDAANADELAQSLAEAVNTITHYDVLTPDGDLVVSAAAFGQPVAMRPGTYRLRVPGMAETRLPRVEIRSAETERIKLKP